MMTRTDAILIILKEIHQIKDSTILADFAPSEVDLALRILSSLEKEKVIDKNDYGSVCSRCNHTGWDSET